MLEEQTCPKCGTALRGARWSPYLCPACSLQLALEVDSGQIDLGESELETPTLELDTPTLAEGQSLGGRYRIRALLGRGGMGEVWRAVDLKLRVEVALKALKAELLTDEKALESLRQEVRMAREVISPNVCQVFDLVELEGQELLSMEYIDGITLLDILKIRAPLDLFEAREIASQFLAGLEAIHETGLIHRDVKPENIMMTRSGRVVLMDFGIAKGLAEVRTGTVSGTPAYMAPEQTRGEPPSARADVLSAGVVLAEMLAPSGLSSFEDRQAVSKGLHRQPPRVPKTAWETVIGKAVSPQAESRYPSASALSRGLEEVALRVDRAEAEERRATASQLLALGRLEVESSNSGALAYALASLVHEGNVVSRRFALELLWRAPTARVVEAQGAQSLDFSPDGEWLAVGYVDGKLKLWPRHGGEPFVLDRAVGSEKNVIQVRFGPESDRLVSQDYGTNTIRVWSIPRFIRREIGWQRRVTTSEFQSTRSGALFGNASRVTNARSAVLLFSPVERRS